MNYTTNYQLPTWVETDRIQMDDFNDMTEKLDAALVEVQNSVDGQTVAIAAKGNCQLYAGSYVGTGTYGTSSPNSFTFPKIPLAVLISDSYAGYVLWATNGMRQSYAQSSQGTVVNLTWEGNTVKWVNNNTNVGQLNYQGRTYYVYALLDAAE